MGTTGGGPLGTENFGAGLEGSTDPGLEYTGLGLEYTGLGLEYTGLGLEYTGLGPGLEYAV